MSGQNKSRKTSLAESESRRRETSAVEMGNEWMVNWPSTLYSLPASGFLYAPDLLSCLPQHFMLDKSTPGKDVGASCPRHEATRGMWTLLENERE